MRKGIVIKKIVCYIILFLLASGGAVYAEEMEGLKPTLDVKEIKPSSGYFGLEIKWSVEENMGSGISVKITYMDPEVFLAYVNYEAERKNWSPQEKEEKKKEILNLLKEYLIFKIFFKHQDNPDYTKITNWRIFLTDDLGNKYLPEKTEGGKAELKRGFTGPYYGRDSYVYFPKYRASNDKPVLTEVTRWMKIELSQSSKVKEFKWIFFQEGEEKRSPYYFYPYLKVSLVILLILLILLVWITRPGKALRNTRGT